VRLRAYPRTGGDRPNFAESAEQNGTVPFSETKANRFLGRLELGPYSDTTLGPRPKLMPLTGRPEHPDKS
jgi:hypothetical protein